MIAKRPIANASFGAGESPEAYADEYHARGKAMLDINDFPWAEHDPVRLSLAFVLDEPNVDTAIVGTADPSHMRDNIATAEKWRRMPSVLGEGTSAELRWRFSIAGGGEWQGLR